MERRYNIYVLPPTPPPATRRSSDTPPMPSCVRRRTFLSSVVSKLGFYGNRRQRQTLHTRWRAVSLSGLQRNAEASYTGRHSTVAARSPYACLSLRKPYGHCHMREQTGLEFYSPSSPVGESSRPSASHWKTPGATSRAPGCAAIMALKAASAAARSASVSGGGAPLAPTMA